MSTHPTPESTSRDVDSLLRIAVVKARQGHKAEARRLLLAAVEEDPLQEELWLWLAGLAESVDDARLYLETVLSLNPEHARAREGLRRLGVEPPLPPVAPPEAATFESPPEESPGEPAPRVDAHGELRGLTLSVAQAEAIDVALERMAYESEASCIILADITGQLIAERGASASMNTQVLSALAAGEIAATQEMARLVGERARFSLLLHEGDERSVYLSHVGDQLLLIIVFDSDTPIGLVRIILKQAVEELAPLMEGGPEEESAPLDDDFARLVEHSLNSTLDFAPDGG